jgi:hypothetical protein
MISKKILLIITARKSLKKSDYPPYALTDFGLFWWDGV